LSLLRDREVSRDLTKETRNDEASPADAHWVPVYPFGHEQLNVPEELTVQDPSFLQGLGEQGVEVAVGVAVWVVEAMAVVVGGGMLQVVPV